MKERRIGGLSNREFQTVLDGIPDSLSLISEDRWIEWTNRGTLDLLHLRSPPVGERCSVLCLGSDACGDCPVHRCLISGRTEDARVRTPDGRFWGVKAFPLPDAEGHKRRVMRWASDVTERVRAQEESIRTSRLASLGELAAGVAHEINNPNGLILLNAALLQDVWTDALPLLEERYMAGGDLSLGGLAFPRLRQEMPVVLEETRDAAQRIRRIVEDLKNFARLDSAEQTETVDVNGAVRTALRLVGPVLVKATSHVTLELEADLPPVTGQTQRLEQVIVNLLMNALQALPGHDRGIAVFTRFEPEPGRILVLVQDEGVGISADILPHITDPFFTTRRKSGGTGLGLAVSARIVKEHGGQLHFASRPGTGTTVTMSLPALKETFEA